MTKLDCGMPLSRLSAYADSSEAERRGKFRSTDKHVASCAHCQNALASLQSINDWGSALRSSVEQAPVDRNWASELMTRLSLPVKEGRRIAVDADANADLALTEAALRRLVRSECSTPNVLILTTKVDAEDEAVAKARAHLQINCDIAVKYGCNILDEASAVRDHIFGVLEDNLGRRIESIDISVVDVYEERHESCSA